MSAPWEVIRALPEPELVDCVGDGRCPWCKADLADSSISFEALSVAWTKGDIEADHTESGEANGGVSFDCGACGKPLMLELTHYVWDGETLPGVTVYAVRTAKDARLTTGAAA